MQDPLFLCLPLLFLSFVVAAPGDSSSCRQVPQNPAAVEIAAQYLQIPGCDDGSTGGSGDGVANDTKSDSSHTSYSSSGSTTTAKQQQPSTIASAKPQQTSTIASAKPQQNSTIAAAPGSNGGKCPAGFRNTVFNTGAANNAGWPQTTWDSLTANGVSDWSKSMLSHQEIFNRVSAD